MKLIPLTQGLFAEVDDDMFDYLNQWKWCAHKDHNTYYAVRSETKSGKVYTIKMHRVIMKTPDGMVVDHINGNGICNLGENMRNCTHAQNIMNKQKRISSKSKYKGVSFLIVPSVSKTKITYYEYWQVSVRVDGKKKHIGNFKDEVEAAKKYNEAALFHFGEYARLNIIEEEHKPILNNNQFAMF